MPAQMGAKGDGVIAVVTFVNRMCGEGGSGSLAAGAGGRVGVRARFSFFRLGFISVHAALHFASLSHLLSYFNARAKARKRPDL